MDIWGNPRGIAFDLDGVLVNSMETNAALYQGVLRNLGVHVEQEDVLLLEGSGGRSILETLLKEAGIMPDPDLVEAAYAEKHRLYRAHGSPALFPEAPELVRRAQGLGWLTAVVTGGTRRNVAWLLGELFHSFNTVVAREDCMAGKPNPAPYLEAARRLDLPPKQLVALENAPLGIDSAKRAGYGRVLAVATTLPRSVLAEADHVFPDLQACLASLARGGES